MRILKVLSALLCYPTLELIAALPELEAVLDREPLLPRDNKISLGRLLDELRRNPLLMSQERYVALFDRGRALSLHLFEHIHGESRDRGQAMVDLLALYEAQGLELAARELPDYLPLFLEFLALLPRDEAITHLRDASPVLGLLGARLDERRDPYRAIFAALLQIAGVADEAPEIRAAVANEDPDETLVHMDEIWEEEAVSFLSLPGGCARKPSETHPIKVRRPLERRPVPAV